MSSSLGWGKGFGEEFAGMYRMKRNKRSDAHDMMDKTFKSIVHTLAHVSSCEEEDIHGSEEKDGHDREEEHVHDSEEDGRKQDHWNANGDEANQVHSDSRSLMLDTIDKLTEPTACSLLDGTVELAQ
jgi:hypothetical protein